MLVAFWRVPSCSSRNTFRIRCCAAIGDNLHARKHCGHLQRGLVRDGDSGDSAAAHAVDQACHLVVGELGSFAAQESVEEVQEVVSQKDSLLRELR